MPRGKPTHGFLGDSVTGIAAARAAGARPIGFANRAGKREQFDVAGADAIITRMNDLASAL